MADGDEPELRKRMVVNSEAKEAEEVQTKKKKKKKKKRTQDHEKCAGTGTLDQLFIVFFVMVIGLIAVVVYMWKTRRFRFLQELDAEAAAAGH